MRMRSFQRPLFLCIWLILPAKRIAKEVPLDAVALRCQLSQEGHALLPGFLEALLSTLPAPLPSFSLKTLRIGDTP